MRVPHSGHSFPTQKFEEAYACSCQNFRVLVGGGVGLPDWQVAITEKMNEEYKKTKVNIGTVK